MPTHRNSHAPKHGLSISMASWKPMATHRRFNLTTAGLVNLPIWTGDDRSLAENCSTKVPREVSHPRVHIETQLIPLNCARLVSSFRCCRRRGAEPDEHDGASILWAVDRIGLHFFAWWLGLRTTIKEEKQVKEGKDRRQKENAHATRLPQTTEKPKTNHCWEYSTAINSENMKNGASLRPDEPGLQREKSSTNATNASGQVTTGAMAGWRPQVGRLDRRVSKWIKKYTHFANFFGTCKNIHTHTYVNKC